MTSKSTLTVGVACSLIATAVYAVVVPGAAQPQQVGQALMNQEQINSGRNYQAESPSTAEHNYLHVKKSDKSLRFKLNNILLSGQQIFSERQLLPLYENYLHKIITFEQLNTIVMRITNYYRQHGYISSQAVLIPQHAKRGIVRIRIIEGTLSKVAISGSPGKVRCMVSAYGKKIQGMGLLNYAQMQKYILLANEIPGTQVQGVVTPSRDQANASNLTLLTNHKSVEGYLAYDNYGTRYIGPQKITGNIKFNSAFLSGDSTQFTVVKSTKGKALSFLDGNYGFALNTEGDRLLLGATFTKTHPLFVLAPSDIDGLNKNYYAAFTFPRIRSSNQNLTYLAGANANFTHVSSFNAKLFEDNIRSIAFGVLYDSVDRFNGSNSLYADIRQGLPILGHTTDVDRATAQTSRPGGKSVYTKLDFSMSRSHTLNHHISLFGHISGQYSFQPLLTAEQFAYGGSQLGRGYDPAELLGDRALSGSVEARYDMTVYNNFLQTMQLYGFFDAGKVWNLFANNGFPTSMSANSAGAGIRFSFTKHLSGNLWFAKPLTKVVAAEDIVGKGHAVRGFFSLVAAI